MKLPPEQQADLVDLGFMDARAKLLDIAAFLDRVERHDQENDYRVQDLYKMLSNLNDSGAERVKNILIGLSDPSTEPIAKAHTKGAAGAYDPEAVL